MKIFSNLCIVLILLLALAHSGYADIASMSVVPVSKSIALSRGETKEVTFIAVNNADVPQHVNIKPRHWYMAEENRSFPIETWLKSDFAEFDIGPRESKEVTFQVTVPERAVGELAAMIAFKPKPKERQAVNVVFSVSLYVRIKETEDIVYRINDFRLWKFADRDALGIGLSIKNLGNIHLNPKTNIFIQNIFSRNINRVSLRPGGPAYPGESKDYQGAIYNFTLKPGVYKILVDTEFTNTLERLRKKIYFIVGRNGKILFMFFRRPKDG